MDGGSEQYGQRSTRQVSIRRDHELCSKFAPFFYGPFRDARKVPRSLVDRRSYQWIGQCREAMREVELDFPKARHGVVEPALPYLDFWAGARRALAGNRGFIMSAENCDA